MTLRTPTRLRTLQEHCARFRGYSTALDAKPLVLPLCVPSWLPCLADGRERSRTPPVFEERIGLKCLPELTPRTDSYIQRETDPNPRPLRH